MDPHTLGVLTLCLLLRPGLALDCTWDSSPDSDQVRDGHPGVVLGEPEMLDPQSCREKCCNRSDCDVAVVGYTTDGKPRCDLWSCANQDQNQTRGACVPGPSLQASVFVKQVKKGSGKEAMQSPEVRSSDPPRNLSHHVFCRLPVKVGQCRALLPRFFYNVTEQKCRGFMFGGCNGNGNNFVSEGECETTCGGVTGSVLPPDSSPAPVKAPRMVLPYESGAAESVPRQATDASADEHAERCGVEPEVGPCRAAFQRWFYNQRTGTCQSFIYGGCRGNKNNYMSEDSCVAMCAVSVQPSSKKSGDAVSTENKVECLLTPDPGPCRAAFPKFFFNLKTGTCQSFMYGGCHGNENRYSTLEECMSYCGPDGSTDARGKNNRWTAAFFLFITLAFISALLLVTLILVSLRRHRLSRRPSISDKEELLPNDQSSVESLSLPESPRADQA